MRKSIFPILTILTAFLIAALLAASCGGDEPGDAPTATTDQAPTAQPTQAQADAQPTEPAPTPTATATSAAPANSQRAPELVGIESWINSEPLTLEGLRGKVVLIDFWTYTCINCLRTLPFLKEWHAKYSDNGLVIIGVHAPEFEFEKVRQNVVDATVVDGIEWPVAQDNDFMTWRAYSNNFWPAKYLVDKDGFIRYSHFGEGAYAETEEQIRELLGEAGFGVSNVDAGEEPERTIDFRAYTNDAATRITRELYAGVERNYAKALSQQEPPYVAHQEYYSGASRDIAYEDPGNHVNQFIFLQGLWNNGLENLTHARTTENYEDYIATMFYGTSVNVVLSLEDAEPYEVRVTYDDRPLQASEAGADIMFDDQGNSFLRVTESRMYRVVDIPEYGGHELKLSSNSADFAVFAYTFGAFTE